MLDASREQAGHTRGGVHCLAQPLSDLLGVTVGAAGQLLKLIDQQDQLPIVALGDPLGQLKRCAQLLQWVAASARWLKGDLHRLAQFGLHAQHGSQRTSAERTRAEVARTLDQPLDRRMVGERLLCERLRERSGVGVLEQADAHRVEPFAPQRRDGRFADRALPRAAWRGEDAVQSVRELGGKLLDIALTADELTRRTDRLLGGKQISRSQTTHVVHYANYG